MTTASMGRMVWIGLLTTGMLACGEDKDSETTNTVFDQEGENEDNVDGSGCPSIVPEEFQFLWDCENTQDDCSGKLYRHAVGESFEDGSFELTEQWYLFNGPGEYCVDTFNIVGQYDSREPSTFGCISCESMYEIYWMMTDSQCEVIWSPLFADQEASNPANQEYYGFVMLDTHGGWDLRYEEMLVIAAPVNGSQYAPNNNYARGTATPTAADATPAGEADPLIDEHQPALYEWSNAGDCLQ